MPSPRTVWRWPAVTTVPPLMTFQRFAEGRREPGAGPRTLRAGAIQICDLIPLFSGAHRAGAGSGRPCASGPLGEAFICR